MSTPGRPQAEGPTAQPDGAPVGPPPRARRAFSTRLSLVLALLLLAFGGLVALLGRHVSQQQEQEALQRLSHGLAGHIVGHWPEISAPDRDAAERSARAALLTMLMTVNPGVQVYLLDADGQVQHYIGEPGMVRQPQVDLGPVRAFLAGAGLPLRGTDPMGSGVPRIFSAAMFPVRAGDLRPPGYLYIVLDGAARVQVAGQLGAWPVWRGAALAAAIGLLATLGVGLFSVRQLTRPLHRLAGRLASYQRHGGAAPGPGPASAAALPAPPPVGDEVQAIEQAFERMTQRLQAQAEREQHLAADHREMMASLAHDLRSPLTALHGHLEALASETAAGAARRDTLLQVALAQSRRVNRLSQQLFELAALQAPGQVLQRERFSLAELVSDAVQKFALHGATPQVSLQGVPPGRLELDADLQLVERALTNLIDNAVRHAPPRQPVRVSLRLAGDLAEVLVEDDGPGLPEELHARLDQGQSLREPPVRRRSGGLGGLGLAIAQRVAQLHGGSLRPLQAPQGGTRLCLALPLAA
ncbi:sensor histidine kinase [Aquabacterium sp. OR-4]|uniref:sensor histidine kinase n=1 Tax=Aquabacterium sp. OR-4 TaxID=2978127 RepID=UPI0028C8F510|nr:HAMP domain-containing sensor histidine kinase [Aquabacterium sp. OR-4]MDT7838058.1 HAMP domain-containing sensor histidine kinase [Aquabacterium sp. OR-4]